MVGAGVEGGAGEVVASLALFDFLDFFFFFFFVAVEAVEGVTVVGSSSASGGDGGGVKIWTGSAAVQESVSEVEVMEWRSQAEEGLSPESFKKMSGGWIW